MWKYEFSELAKENNRLNEIIQNIESKIEESKQSLKLEYEDTINKKIEEVKVISNTLKDMLLDLGGNFEIMKNDLKKEMSEELKSEIVKRDDLTSVAKENSRKKVEEDSKMIAERLTKLENKCTEPALPPNVDLNVIRSDINKYVSEEVKKNTTENIRKELVQTMTENEEKERRKKNVIIFNLKESVLPDINARFEEDFDKCLDIFKNEIGIEQFKIVKLTRLSGPNDNNHGRPTVVQLQTEGQKWAIISKAKNLKNSTKYGAIYVVRDMTYNERVLDKKLREELKNKRENGETNWKIKNGQLVEINSTPIAASIDDFIDHARSNLENNHNRDRAEGAFPKNYRGRNFTQTRY